MADQRSKTALRKRISELNLAVGRANGRCAEACERAAKFKAWSEKSEADCRAAEEREEATARENNRLHGQVVAIESRLKVAEQERDTAVKDQKATETLLSGEVSKLKQELQELRQFRRAVRATAHDTSADNMQDWQVIGTLYLLATEARKHSVRV